jgi:hypothetical protein
MFTPLTAAIVEGIPPDLEILRNLGDRYDLERQSGGARKSDLGLCAFLQLQTRATPFSSTTRLRENAIIAARAGGSVWRRHK